MKTTPGGPAIIGGSNGMVIVATDQGPANGALVE